MADLVTIRTDGGRTFRVARDQAQRLKNMLNDIELRMPIGADSGGYANRHISGTNIPSRHATGHAIDINWNSNPEGPRSGAIRKYLTPEELAAIEKTHGVEWGGRWNRPFKGADDMHFETPRAAAPAPLGAPLQRMPASSGLNDVPEQGLAPLSLLPQYRSPFAAPDTTPQKRPSATPAPEAPSPKPAQEPVIAAKPPDPARPTPESPFAKPPAAAAAKDSGFDQFHAGATQSAQRMAQEWMQRRRPKTTLPSLFGEANA
jgi:hypothetical protein